MSEEGVERKLTAILAADVVGYSRLMGEDEAGTLARLKSLRKELVQPKIAGGRGRIVKLMGDGLLAEFPSVVEAVRCAVDIQQDMAGREADLPDDRRIRLRIGVNLGDIIVEGSDIYGDGVNVAARLEGLAEPGGICISGKVYQEVRNKLPTAFEDLGEQEVKNIREPVRVYRWTDAAADPMPGMAGAEGALPLPDKPSIAVLPFVNMSGDPEQEYFSDGITEDIITALSKLRWLFVTSRGSTFTYKGKAVGAKQVTNELGVRYILEGSVRKAGNRVRITAQLIDGTTDSHMWAEHYDRQLDEIFVLQDEITQMTVGAIEPELAKAERERAKRKPAGTMDAWDCYQRGLWHLYQYTRDHNSQAQRLFAQSIELDPNFSPAFAYSAFARFLDVVLGYIEPSEEVLAEALRAGLRAVALDSKDPVAYWALGRVHMIKGEHDAAITNLERAIDLNPSFAFAHFGLGFALNLCGRAEAAIPEFDEAIRLSPNDPFLSAFLAMRALALLLIKQHEEAAEWAGKSVQLPRVEFWAYTVLSSSLGYLGRSDESRAALDEALRIQPALTTAFIKETLPFKNTNVLEHFLDGLRKAGLPE